MAATIPTRIKQHPRIFAQVATETQESTSADPAPSRANKCPPTDEANDAKRRHGRDPAPARGSGPGWWGTRGARRRLAQEGRERIGRCRRRFRCSLPRNPAPIGDVHETVAKGHEQHDPRPTGSLAPSIPAAHRWREGTGCRIANAKLSPSMPDSNHAGHHGAQHHDGDKRATVVQEAPASAHVRRHP